MATEAIRNQAEQDVDPRVDLAVLRTELAADRTMLAWLRTALALIGTGVAFDKGVQLLHERRLASGTALVHGSHVVGLSLTAIVTILLAILLWQYRRKQVELARIKGAYPPAFSPTTAASLVVILLGVAVFWVLTLSN